MCIKYNILWIIGFIFYSYIDYITNTLFNYEKNELFLYSNNRMIKYSPTLNPRPYFYKIKICPKTTKIHVILKLKINPDFVSKNGEIIINNRKIYQFQNRLEKLSRQGKQKFHLNVGHLQRRRNIQQYLC